MHSQSCRLFLRAFLALTIILTGAAVSGIETAAAQDGGALAVPAILESRADETTITITWTPLDGEDVKYQIFVLKPGASDYRSVATTKNDSSSFSVKRGSPADPEDNLFRVKVRAYQQSPVTRQTEFSDFSEPVEITLSPLGIAEDESTPGPTPTPDPDESPDPEVTPEPTPTPGRTRTAVPTRTPRSTSTPRPTLTPRPTRTSVPTRTPRVTVTPGGTPTRTPTPDGTRTPAPTATRNATRTPGASPTPGSLPPTEFDGGLSLRIRADGSVRLTWKDVEYEMSYEIERDGEVIDTLPEDAGSYTDDLNDGGTGSNYTVHAYNEAGESSASAMATSEGPLVQPTDARAWRSDDGCAAVTWSYPNSIADSIIGFVVTGLRETSVLATAGIEANKRSGIICPEVEGEEFDRIEVSALGMDGTLSSPAMAEFEYE